MLSKGIDLPNGIYKEWYRIKANKRGQGMEAELEGIAKVSDVSYLIIRLRLAKRINATEIKKTKGHRRSKE